MTDAPKLLTEAEWHEYYAAVGVGWAITCKIVEGHRERGLIAPEPKPPVELALEKELQAAVFQSDYGKVSWSNGFRVGFMRGMELQREASNG